MMTKLADEIASIISLGLKFSDSGDDTDCQAIAAEILEYIASVAPTWQPIETAPRDGFPILIACARTQSIRWAVWSGKMWRDGQASAGGRVSGVPAPTHWQPLPSPPVDDHG